MSIYSEIVIRCRLRSDIPDTALQEIKYWLGLVDLKTIDSSTWYYGMFGVLDEGAHYLPGADHRSLERYSNDSDYTLMLSANNKYYERQIEKFLLRIVQYSGNEGFVGYKMLEIEDVPTLIFFEEGKVLYRKPATFEEIVLSDGDLSL